MRSPRERSPEPDDAPESSPPSDYSFWNPFSLTFPTRSKEDRYIKQNLDAWLTQDMFAHVLGCLPGPFYVYNLYSLLPLWYTILWLTLSLVYAPINIYIFCKHREVYEKLRLCSVAFIRLFIPFCFIGFGFYDTLPAASQRSIIMCIFTKSAAVNMVFSCLNFRVIFRHHLLIHTLAFLISLLWIPGFCHRAVAEPALVDKFQEMGRGIDSVFAVLFVNKVPDVSVHYPCWMIVTMVITLTGYVFPTLIVFATEVSGRTMFLRIRIAEEYQLQLQNFKQSALRVGVIGTAAASVAIWLGMTLIRDALQ